MIFLSSTAKKGVIVCLAVLFVAIRALPPSNAFAPTTTRCRRCYRENWSTSLSPPSISSSSSSLFLQLPWSQRKSNNQNQRPPPPQQQQQESIELWSPEDVEDPYGQYLTSPQQQQSSENIHSYDTGGNSFAQPIGPSELSVGRRNGKTMYSTVGVCSTSSSRTAFYQRDLSKKSKSEMFKLEFTTGDKSSNGGQHRQQQGKNQSRLGGGSGSGILGGNQYKSSNGSQSYQQQGKYQSRLGGAGGGDILGGNQHRGLAKQSKPGMLQPELTIGRTRNNGYKSANGGRSHQQQGKYQSRLSGGGSILGGNQHRGLAKQSKSDMLQPELTIGRTRDNGYKFTNGGQNRSDSGSLQHYGTGEYSFSQPINPSEAMTGGIRSRSDGGRRQTLPLKKHYGLQLSNTDSDNNDQYRNGDWSYRDEIDHGNGRSRPFGSNK